MGIMIAVSAALLALIGTSRPEAGMILYTETITTDGTLGGMTFTGHLVTINLYGDTANLAFASDNSTITISLATVTVNGIGTATFNDTIKVVTGGNSSFSDLLVMDLTTGFDILDTFVNASGFAGYDLKGPIGPVMGGAAYPLNSPSSITLGMAPGSFSFTKKGGGQSYVTASVAEPASLGLVSLGSVGLLCRRGRRGR